ncbi:putative conserved alanine and proline rich protein [Mycobacterium kansasii]|uniref:Putative conserved alanine and proline rich protein n=1 Tax=Mycobacterium kansasii TaxID=1768 RepID=A0A1V3XJE2_MYCKA|nr:putative conserved alanine and proline rich protein [Mycobacterium kansasii]
MASTWSLSKGLAAAVVTSAAAFGLCPAAAADPAAPQPNPNQQLPGLPALTQLSPIIQQAASNPGQATQLLMAAAQAFVHNPAAPPESKNVAASVNQFVAEPTNPGSPALGVPAPAPAPETAPVPHVPPPGVEPGMLAHLPTGVDPAHAAGPRRLLRRVEHRPLRPPHRPPHRLLRPVEHRPLRPRTGFSAGWDTCRCGSRAGRRTRTGSPVGRARAGFCARWAPAPAPPSAAPAPAPKRPTCAGRGSGGGTRIRPDTPPTQDFMYPSIGTNCLADGSNVIATALSVAGPAKIPSPGPGRARRRMCSLPSGPPDPPRFSGCR